MEGVHRRQKRSCQISTGPLLVLNTTRTENRLLSSHKLYYVALLSIAAHPHVLNSATKKSSVFLSALQVWEQHVIHIIGHLVAIQPHSSLSNTWSPCRRFHSPYGFVNAIVFISPPSVLTVNVDILNKLIISSLLSLNMSHSKIDQVIQTTVPTAIKHAQPYLECFICWLHSLKVLPLKNTFSTNACKWLLQLTMSSHCSVFQCFITPF